MNLALLLETIAASRPDGAAVADPDGSLTYGELRERSAALGDWIGRETRPGAIAFVGTNRRDLVALMFGAAYAGRPFFPLNYRATAAEMERLLGLTDAAFAVVDERNLPLIEEAASALADPPPLARSLPDVSAASVDVVAPMIPDAPAVYLTTSGTTSDPKVAVITHANLFGYVTDTVAAGSAGPEETALLSAPAYHIANVAQIFTNVYRGRRIFMLPQFDAASWLDVVRGERVSHAMVVPTMLSRIVDRLEEPGEEAPESLLALSYGGSKADADLVERAMRALPDRVGLSNAFGLTETSSTVAVLGPAEHRAALESDDPEVRARLGSVGRAVPGMEIAVRAEGRWAAAGEVGEICVRGGHVFQGYLGRAADRDGGGWLHTSDQGWMDAGGFLFIGSRQDDVIIRGGENIDPADVEALLREHPAVEDGLVVGIPDPEWGETVAALVVPGAEVSVEDLRAWLRGRLPGFKVPQRIVWSTEVPRNDLGKPVRRLARAEVLADPTPATRGGSR